MRAAARARQGVGAARSCVSIAALLVALAGFIASAPAHAGGNDDDQSTGLHLTVPAIIKNRVAEIMGELET